MVFFFFFPVRQISSVHQWRGWKINFIITSHICFHSSIVIQDFWASVKQKSKMLARFLLICFLAIVTPLLLHAEIQPCSLSFFLGHVFLESLEIPLTAALLADEPHGPSAISFVSLLSWGTLILSMIFLVHFPHQNTFLFPNSLQGLCTKFHSGDH